MPTDPAPAPESSPDRGPASRSAGQPAPSPESPPAPRSAATPAATNKGPFPPRHDPRRRALASAIALGAAALSVLIFLLLHPATPRRPPTTPPPATLSAPAPATEPATLARNNTAAKPRPASGTEPETSPDAFPGIEQLNSPATSIRDDLILLSNVFASWQTLFPKEGNPWGDNRDITAALAGRNPQQAALIPPGHPAISRDGELLDRWGTPLLFHQLSGTAMELRSAGPDRVFYTADDTVLTP